MRMPLAQASACMLHIVQHGSNPLGTGVHTPPAQAAMPALKQHMGLVAMGFILQYMQSGPDTGGRWYCPAT